MVPVGGVKPPTCRLSTGCSFTELNRHRLAERQGFDQAALPPQDARRAVPHSGIARRATTLAPHRCDHHISNVRPLASRASLQYVASLRVAAVFLPGATRQSDSAFCSPAQWGKLAGPSFGTACVLAGSQGVETSTSRLAKLFKTVCAPCTRLPFCLVSRHRLER